jgi:hypothetical protein
MEPLHGASSCAGFDLSGALAGVSRIAAAAADAVRHPVDERPSRHLLVGDAAADQWFGRTFFGTNWLALLFGIVSFSHQLGGFAGVWAAGVLFDATGSYDPMWQISLALGIVAALLHWPIREHGVARLKAKPA